MARYTELHYIQKQLNKLSPDTVITVKVLRSILEKAELHAAQDEIQDEEDYYKAIALNQ